MGQQQSEESATHKLPKAARHDCKQTLNCRGKAAILQRTLLWGHKAVHVGLLFLLLQLWVGAHEEPSA
eukprot:4262382-Amphidinium_carterae.1